MNYLKYYLKDNKNEILLYNYINNYWIKKKKNRVYKLLRFYK